MIQEMFVRARALGLEPYGSNDGKPRNFKDQLHSTNVLEHLRQGGNC